MAPSPALARWLLVSALLGGGWLSGCAISSTGGGTTATGTGGVPATGDGGACPVPQPICAAGQQASCYRGDPGTEGTGSCHAGTQTCLEGGYGSCEGESLPAPVTCAAPTVFSCGATPSCGALAFQVIPPPPSNPNAGAGGKPLAFDAQGNVFALSGTADPYGHASLSLGKLDPTGKSLWSKTFTFPDSPTGSSDNAGGFGAMAVGTDGRVILGGSLESSSMSFGGPPLSGSPNGTGMVVALDAAGNHLWSETLDTSALPFMDIHGVALDGANNVYVAGGRGTALVAKLDPSGNLLWSKTLDSRRAWANALALDGAGNVYVAGFLDFIPPGLPAACEISPVLLASLDGAGTLRWSKVFGGPAPDAGASALAVSPSGDIFLTGDFFGPLDLGGGVLGGGLVENGGIPGGTYVARFDPTGAHVWSMPVDDQSLPAGLGLDAAGNVIVATEAGRVVKIRPNGIPFSSRIQTTGGAGLIDFRGIAVGPQGNVLLTGEYTGVVDFGLGPAPEAHIGNTFILALDP